MREIKYQAFVDDEIIEGRKAAIYPVKRMMWDDEGLIAVDLEPCGWIDTKWVNLREYTGLKDKNGVEIYEGDLLNFKYDAVKKHLWKVTFENGAFRRGLIKGFRNMKLLADGANELSSLLDEFEVIGNSYTQTPNS